MMLDRLNILVAPDDAAEKLARRLPALWEIP